MVNLEAMHFSVQGSAALPYKISAHGFGDAPQMFCNCPAGRKARMFCKHVAALLMGDITALVRPSDCVVELARRAVGSALIADAFHHQPARPRPSAPAAVTLDAEADAGLAAALATVVGQARELGWVVEAEPDLIGLFRYARTGNRLLKYPDVAIAYNPDEARCYAVSCAKRTGKAFVHLDRAAAYFADMAERHAPQTAGA